MSGDLNFLSSNSKSDLLDAAGGGLSFAPRRRSRHGSAGSNHSANSGSNCSSSAGANNGNVSSSEYSPPKASQAQTPATVTATAAATFFVGDRNNMSGLYLVARQTGYISSAKGPSGPKLYCRYWIPVSPSAVAEGVTEDNLKEDFQAVAKVAASKEEDNAVLAAGPSACSVASGSASSGAASSGAPCPEYPAAKALVFLSHGFGEHLCWYEELASRLASSAGVLVFGHDHHGHGNSEGERGMPHPGGDVDSFVSDVFTHAAKLKIKFRGLPCFIYGHSMGGMITIRAIKRNPSFFRGAVLEGPLIKMAPNKFNVVKYYLAQMVNYAYPNFSLDEIKPEEVTSDPSYQAMFSADTLNYRGCIKLGIMVPFMHMLVEFATTGFFNQFRIPFLILQGEKDSLCLIEGARIMHAKAKSEDKSLITFPTARHHLLLEKEEVRTQAIQETLQWIRQRLDLQPEALTNIQME